MGLKTPAVSITALGAPKAPQFLTFSTASLAEQVTALQAQVTTLTAKVAAMQAILDVSRLDENSVTQKKYNTLARKWNAAFPSQAVALKK